jgi:hypothetical protein
MARRYVDLYERLLSVGSSALLPEIAAISGHV